MRRAPLAAALVLLLACVTTPPRLERAIRDVNQALLARDYDAADAYALDFLDSLSFYGEDHPYYALGLDLRAEVAYRADRFEDAETLALQSLAIREAAFGSDDPRITPSLLHLGRARVARQEYAEAERTLERALGVREPPRLSNEGAIREIHYWWGLAAMRRGDLESAGAHFSEAHRLGASPWYPSVPIREAQLQYAEVPRKLGREREARNMTALAVGSGTSGDYLDDVKLYSNSGVLMRWRREQMPLRVHLPPPPEDTFEDPERVRAVVRNAILAWRDVVEPGVPSFRFVERRRGAEIRIRWIDPTRTTVLALTRFKKTWDGDGSFVQWIDVAGRYTDDLAVPEEQLHGIVLHEMGHALGMWGHSGHVDDLMYAAYDGRAIGIGPRDRATLRKLYDLDTGTE